MVASVRSSPETNCVVASRRPRASRSSRRSLAVLVVGGGVLVVRGDVRVVVRHRLVAEGVQRARPLRELGLAPELRQRPGGSAWRRRCGHGDVGSRMRCHSGTPSTSAPRFTRRRGPNTHGAGTGGRPVSACSRRATRADRRARRRGGSKPGALTATRQASPRSLREVRLGPVGGRRGARRSPRLERKNGTGK